MLLLIDNYDSFSYNLFQLVGAVEPDIRVVRNDELTVGEVGDLAPDAIIISPGPGRPADAGICEDVIRTYAGKIPIFGVCLGHQAISEVFGASVSYAPQLMHGKQSRVTFRGESPLFEGVGDSMPAARYHSLATVAESISEELLVTAVSDDGAVMAVEHRDYPVYGVQFHPESVMTPEGITIIRNFMKIVEQFQKGTTA